MAQGFVGADVQQLKDLAAQLKTAGAGFGTIEGRLSALVSDAAWRGPDAGRFASDWHSIHRPSLRTASELLRTRALDLAKQASEQEAASATSGAGISHASGATASPSLESEFTQFSSGKKTPYEVADWWSKLSEAEQQKLIAAHPEIVGNLEGVNFTDRDTANRLVLDQQIAAAKSSGNKDLLSYLTKTKVTLGQDTPPPRQLISLLAEAPPRVAISVGDLDKADYASYLVPGMGSNSAGSVADTTKDAAALYNEERRLAGANGKSTKVAVVAWLAYDSPEMAASTKGLDPAVFQGDLARTGGVTLEKALAGYDAVINSQPGRSSASTFLSVDGHSYGSTTAGNALASLPPGVVDSFVTLGSAGIEHDVGGASGLHVPDGQVYAIQGAEALPAAQIGLAGSGRDNPSDPNFGAVNLSSGISYSDGEWRVPSTVHDLQTTAWGFKGYLDPQTTALKNTAYVNLGMGDRAVRTR